MKHLKVPGSMLMLQKFKPLQDQKKGILFVFVLLACNEFSMSTE